MAVRPRVHRGCVSLGAVAQRRISERRGQATAAGTAVLPLMLREFVHPAVVQERHQLLRFLRGRDHHDGSATLHQRNERQPAAPRFAERTRADEPGTALKPLRGRTQRQHFVDETPEQGGVVPLAPARATLVVDQCGQLESGALAIGLGGEFFHTEASGILESW
jgi:hypothetical protein